MGVTNDMHDMIVTLVNVIQSYNNDGELVGNMIDKIAYSDEYRGLRTELDQLGLEFIPYTPIKVQDFGGRGEVNILDINDNDIMTVDEVDGMEEDEILSHVYENYWDEVMEHYERLAIE